MFSLFYLLTTMDNASGHGSVAVIELRGEGSRSYANGTYQHILSLIMRLEEWGDVETPSLGGF
jgi:hypothetical protein